MTRTLSRINATAPLHKGTKGRVKLMNNGHIVPKKIIHYSLLIIHYSLKNR